MLLLSSVIVQRDYLTAGTRTFLVVRTVGQLAALLRMAPLPKKCGIIQNKYVVWTCMFGLVRYIRQHMDEIPVERFKVVWSISFGFCVVLGCHNALS